MQHKQGNIEQFVFKSGTKTKKPNKIFNLTSDSFV